MRCAMPQERLSSGCFRRELLRFGVSCGSDNVARNGDGQREGAESGVFSRGLSYRLLTRERVRERERVCVYTCVCVTILVVFLHVQR